MSDFDKHAEDVRNLKQTPDDAELLKLYGYYKQGTVGDVNIDKPGMFDFKNKKKWDSWNEIKGMSQDDAKKAYIELAKEMIGKYGLK